MGKVSNIEEIGKLNAHGSKDKFMSTCMSEKADLSFQELVFTEGNTNNEELYFTKSNSSNEDIEKSEGSIIIEGKSFSSKTPPLDESEEEEIYECEAHDYQVTDYFCT